MLAAKQLAGRTIMRIFMAYLSRKDVNLMLLRINEALDNCLAHVSSSSCDSDLYHCNDVMPSKCLNECSRDDISFNITDSDSGVGEIAVHRRCAAGAQNDKRAANGHTNLPIIVLLFLWR